MKIHPWKKDLEQFERESRKIHGKKYDYSKFEYINNKTKSLLKCRDCESEFDIRPDSHLNGRGCRTCGYEKAAQRRSKSIPKFIEESIIAHGDRYDYSKVKYKSGLDKVEILCKEHGSFWQEPGNHIRGNGCPICNNSSGELRIIKVLNELKIKYKAEYSFKDFINPETGSNLYFDFYLPEHNMCIEYDGRQHFIPIEFFGGLEAMESAKKRDLLKMKYCKNNNIFMLRISFLDHNKIENIIKSIL